MDTFRQPDDRKTIYSEDADCIRDGNIITARANAYVDFWKLSKRGNDGAE